MPYMDSEVPNHPGIHNASVLECFSKYTASIVLDLSDKFLIDRLTKGLANNHEFYFT